MEHAYIYYKSLINFKWQISVVYLSGTWWYISAMTSDKQISIWIYGRDSHSVISLLHPNQVLLFVQTLGLNCNLSIRLCFKQIYFIQSLPLLQGVITFEFSLKIICKNFDSASWWSLIISVVIVVLRRYEFFVNLHAMFWNPLFLGFLTFLFAASLHRKTRYSSSAHE